MSQTCCTSAVLPTPAIPTMGTTA
uniref:Uncharacterized protein n=1 Tax=Arundo donax TaxID=35708 RepID=A0A0A9FZA2_ARUDO